MIVKDIWQKKYKSPQDTTPEDTFLRVTRAISKGDPELERKFFELMRSLKFIPGGRILAYAGTGNPKATLANCYVMGEIEDSMDGIMKALHESALTLKAGGGIGLNFSTLRPEGDPVKGTASVASGPVSFMEMWNSMSRTISGANARKGATIGVLNIDHPDIEKFIKAKENNTPEKPVLEKFNISVGITDAFMQAVKKDREFTLVFNGKEYKKVKARELMRLIVENAWAKAEPGVVFLDTVNKMNNLWYCETIQATNPCVTGDTLVATPEGYKKAKDFQVGDEVLTVCGTGKVERIEVYHNRPVFEVELSDGGIITVTAAHQFHAMKSNPAKKDKKSNIKKFQLLSLKDLKPGDFIRVHPGALPKNYNLPFNRYGLSDREYGFLVGILIGDGTLTDKTLNRKVVKIATNKNDTEWNNILESLLKKVGYKGVSYEDKKFKSKSYVINGDSPVLKIIQELGLKGESHEKRIPEILLNTNRDLLAGLLDGLFSTDGNVNPSSHCPQLRFATASRMLIADIRNILLMFGIHCSMGINRKHRNSTLEGRQINGRVKYELVIAGESIKKFAKEIGLTRPHKQKRLTELVKNYPPGGEVTVTGNLWRARILSIKPAGNATVYDLYEPTTDTWITNGYVSRGCGELPLPPYGACMLGAINLTQFVLNPFGTSPDIDWNGLKETIKTGVIFLDNTIDICYHPVEEQTRQAYEKRRIGLGIMGLGSTLAMLKVRYGSRASIEWIDKIFSFIRDTAYEASVELARERGPFKMFDKEKYLQGKFIQRLPEHIREAIARHGIRNSCLLTIAPTGSISQLAGYVSSGVEPIFSLEYIRKNPNYNQEILVQDYAWALYKSLYPEVTEKNKPDFFVTAHELTWKEHIDVMAVCQSYVDNSISKTINLPQSTTKEELQEVYFYAWEKGLKGCTIYREGSLEEILKKPAFSKTQLQQTKPQVPRPYKLEGRTYKVKPPEAKNAYYLTFTHLNDNGRIRPYELFINTKNPFFEEWTKALGRLVSAVFRNVENPTFLVDELKEIMGKSGFWSAQRRKYVPSLIAEFGEVMKDYFEEIGLIESEPPVELYEEEAQATAGGESNSYGKNPANSNSYGHPCPVCGAPALVFEEGCTKCLACDYNKCG
jgi:ribonucleoside-diphosphate reductase alpha chain